MKKLKIWMAILGCLSILAIALALLAAHIFTEERFKALSFIAVALILLAIFGGLLGRYYHYKHICYHLWYIDDNYAYKSYKLLTNKWDKIYIDLSPKDELDQFVRYFASMKPTDPCYKDIKKLVDVINKRKKG